jgi:diguanylate cyclase (GGDEF)-like protein
MLPIDVFTCYAVAGAGSLAGLGLIAMIRTDQPRIAQALRLFRGALLCLAALLCIALAPQALRPAVVKAAIGLAAAGVALLAWAFRQLNGRRTNPFLGGAAVCGAALALWSAGALWPDQAYVQAIGAVFALVSLGMAMDQGLVTWRNAKFTGSDLSLLVAACEFALNWLILLVWAFVQPGPYPSHWLHGPAWLLPLTGLSFALLPLAVASVVFATVNDRLQQQLRARALSDDLTGALSRRGLRELGERMLAFQASQPTVLAVLMLDIDFFKDVNDRFGHAAGDEVLRHVTTLVRNSLREDALLARYGGEEFTVLLPVRSRLEARAVAERLREVIDLTPCETRTSPIHVTVSIGVSFHAHDTTLEQDLAAADTCLYEAKHTGRNRVVSSDAAP